ncbi:hypothetical protein IQ225_02110 [Synechocystis salina LEGE 06155]|nr:hypothetical protein [Synechocystis salina LEGE 06155]
MLHNCLDSYLKKVESYLIMLNNVYIEHYLEEILTPNRANLRIRIRWNTGHLLIINKAIIIKDDRLDFLDYRYHFQNEDNNLIFRYDSTPHFPALPTFPHHKHLPNEVIACEMPDLIQVINEAVSICQIV